MLGGVQVNVGGVQNMLGGARMKLGGCAPPRTPLENPPVGATFQRIAASSTA